MPPQQKPHRSKQDYRTPPAFLDAVKRRYGICAFAWDLAADRHNTVARRFFTVQDDALTCEWPDTRDWCWLNPPFGRLEPWVKRAAQAQIDTPTPVLALLPAAVGSDWFARWVDGWAQHVLFLNGRLAFMPEKLDWLYPKDCLLAEYLGIPDAWTQYEVWNWRS